MHFNIGLFTSLVLSTLPAITTACGKSDSKPNNTATTAAALQTTTTTAAPSPFTEVIDDARLERYVGAYIKLQALQIQTQHRLNIAEETMQIAEIEHAQRDAKIMAQAILSEAGLSEKEYLDLRHRLKIDPELNARGEAIFNRFMKAAAPQSQ